MAVSRFWTGREVRDADGGLGLVDVLAASSGRAVGVDLQVLGPDVDLDVRVELRHHLERGEGGVAAAGGVEGGQPDQPVHALFGAQIAICVLAEDHEGDALQAGLVAFEDVGHLDREAASFGPAGVHAVEHLDPVLCLRASRPRVQREDRVVTVVLPREERLEPQLLEVGAQFLQALGHLGRDGEVLGLAAELAQHQQVLPAVLDGAVPVDALL